MNRLFDRLVPVAASLASFALVICFFAPRFMLWQWTDLPSSRSHYAEFNRAIDTLQQLDRPFVPIKNPTNRVINWRLLFPLVGHYVHLPRRIFLGLPHLGCLLVLGYVAHLTQRQTKDRWTAFLASCLVGTGSWFFVSTGWLAYFDSWCLLGLFVVAFSRSKVAMSLACLLSPWIDERFVLTLPLALVVRGLYFGWSEGEHRARSLAEGLQCLTFVAPYVAIRLVALAAAQDAGSTGLLRGQLASDRDDWQLLDGLWSGLRGLWVFVAAPAVLLFVGGHWVWGGLTVLMVLITTVANVLVANDLSRTMSMLVPAAFLGMVLPIRARPALARRLLAVVLLFNLLTPARHVVLGWQAPEPILPLHVEWDHYIHPPRQLAQQYCARGMTLALEGQIPRALEEYDTAIRVDPGSADARLGRGLCLARLSRSEEAAASFDAAVRLAPRRPDVYRARGGFFRFRGLPAPAVEDLRKALDLSPVNAPDRPALERELAEARRALGEQ